MKMTGCPGPMVSHVNFMLFSSYWSDGYRPSFWKKTRVWQVKFRPNECKATKNWIWQYAYKHGLWLHFTMYGGSLDYCWGPETQIWFWNLSDPLVYICTLTAGLNASLTEKSVWTKCIILSPNKIFSGLLRIAEHSEFKAHYSQLGFLNARTYWLNVKMFCYHYL